MVSIAGWPRCDFGVRPQTFEIVKLARAFIEDVQNDITIIENDPKAICAAFGFGAMAGGTQAVLDTFGDALNVGVGCAGADDEKVGHDGLPAYVQHHDVARFHFLSGATDALHQILRFIALLHRWQRRVVNDTNNVFSKVL